MMSYFEPVQAIHASRFLYLGPTILVTSHDKERNINNIMAVGWSTAVEFAPARFCVVIDKGAFSRELISKSGTFGICIPTVAVKDLVYSVGSISGKNMDKFSKYGIPMLKSPELGLPIIEAGCAAWIECRVLPSEQASTEFDTIFGQVVSAQADTRVFKNGHWLFDDSNKNLRTMHYLGDGKFLSTGDAVLAKMI